jgi:hypothetical protein
MATFRPYPSLYQLRHTINKFTLAHDWLQENSKLSVVRRGRQQTSTVTLPHRHRVDLNGFVFTASYKRDVELAVDSCVRALKTSATTKTQAADK